MLTVWPLADSAPLDSAAHPLKAEQQGQSLFSPGSCYPIYK
jgi:hypothetical protein